MYQGNRTGRKCTKCGKLFWQQEGTIAMKSSNYNKCPYCNGDSVRDYEEQLKRQKEHDEWWKKMKELAKKV